MRTGAPGCGAAIPRTLADHTRPMETPGRIAELERKFAENPRRYFAALANEFRKQGELDRAIELCESHLAEQRNHLSGHVVLAQALVDAGRESDAWDPLHTALDLDPENFIALRLIGELSAKVGDIDHARSFFFRALEIEPRNEQLLAAVKTLSPRPAAAVEGEQPAVATPAREPREPKEEPWGDVTPLPGLESTTAFEAVQAAEPVAEEPPAAAIAEAGAAPMSPGDEPIQRETPSMEAGPHREAAAAPIADAPVSEEPVGVELVAGDRDAHEPVAAPAQPIAEEPVLDATAEVTPAHGDPFADWLPGPETVAEPTPEEDWMSAAGSVATESRSDWDSPPTGDQPRAKSYDYHDWLPPLASETETAATAGAAPGVPATDATIEAADETKSVTDDVHAGADEGGAAAGGARLGAGQEPPTRDEPVPAGEPASPAAVESLEARPMLASETMADLYLQQGHVSLAVDVLRELVASRPDDERLRARLAEVGSAAAAPPRETVRDMFARFARTAQPLRERAQHHAVSRHPSTEAEPAGPIGEFFGDSATRTRDARASALLSMVAPPGSAPVEGDALERWLAGLRRP